MYEESVVVTTPGFGGIGRSVLNDFGIFPLQPQRPDELKFQVEKSDLKRVATILVACYTVAYYGDPSVYDATLLWPQFQKRFLETWTSIQTKGGQHDPKALEMTFNYYRAHCPR